MQMRLEIKGLEDLERQLRELGTAIATDIAENAVKSTAQQLAAELKVKAPYRPGGTVRTRRLKSGAVVTSDYGHLRDNIRVRKEKSRTVHWIGYRVGRGRAFWALFLEFGTRRMVARPWFRPTRDAFAPRAKALMAQAFREGVAKVKTKRVKKV